MIEINRDLSQRIKEIRLNLGKSQEDFGKMFDPVAPKSAVSRWEHGKNAPNKSRLKRIAELGGVSVEYLINGLDISTREAINRFEKARNLNATKAGASNDDAIKVMNAFRLEGSITANRMLEFNKKMVLQLLNREKEYVEKIPISGNEADVYNGLISLLEALRLHGSPDQQIDFASIIVSMWQIANGNMEYDKNDVLSNVDKLLSSFPIEKDDSDESK